MRAIIRILAIPLSSVVFCPTTLKAQFPSAPDRLAGAGSTLFQSNLSASTFGNPAVGDSIGGPRVYLYSTQSFLATELTETGVAVSFRLPGSTLLATGFARKGFDLYKRQHAVLSLCRHFGSMTAGLRAAYSGTQFGEGYPGNHEWSVTPGTRIRFGRQVEMLASMRIPLQKEPRNRNEEARLGCIHHFSARFSAGVEAVQTEQGLRISGAVRYKPGERLEIVAGLSGREPVWSFGCCVVVKGLRVLVAASHRSWLGFSPGLSVESPLVRP